MANVSIGHLLDPANTVIATFAVAGSVGATGIKRGILYRVVSDIDVFITYGVAGAVNTGIYLPAKTIDYMVFGMDDIQGTDITVNVYGGAAGHCFFTPAFGMVTR